MSAEGGVSRHELVRHATAGDCAAIAVLLAELGYPDSPAAVEARLVKSRTDGPDAVLVVERDGLATGFASIHLIPLFHRDGFLARITSFVVARHLRGRGIGTELLSACERWAADHSSERVEITSGDERHEAHGFYEGRGFEREGQRFSKWVRR